ncbi:MAG: VOC family protein [Pseudonocardia sp.]|nr:VOC family protein [Pseudonocardia sp.]
MTVTSTTHLNFRGDAREALEFYRSVFDGELVVITYAQMGDVPDPAEADQVVWGQVTAPNGFRVMAFDVPAARPWSRGDDPFFLSVRGDDAGEIAALWAKLTDGAAIKVPLEPSRWAPLYGMLTDRFGVTWVLDVAVAYAAS